MSVVESSVLPGIQAGHRVKAKVAGGELCRESVRKVHIRFQRGSNQISVVSNQEFPLSSWVLCGPERYSISILWSCFQILSTVSLVKVWIFHPENPVNFPEVEKLARIEIQAEKVQEVQSIRVQKKASKLNLFGCGFCLRNQAVVSGWSSESPKGLAVVFRSLMSLQRLLYRMNENEFIHSSIRHLLSTVTNTNSIQRRSRWISRRPFDPAFRVCEPLHKYRARRKLQAPTTEKFRSFCWHSIEFPLHFSLEIALHSNQLKSLGSCPFWDLTEKDRLWKRQQPQNKRRQGCTNMPFKLLLHMQSHAH